MSSGVKSHIRDLENLYSNWENTEQGWQGQKSTIRLQAWEDPRDIVILRRQYKSKKYVVAKAIADKQPVFFPGW